jgi:hypothetical protein
MKSLLSEVDILLNLAGFQNLGQIDRSVLGECTVQDCPGRMLTMMESFLENYQLMAEKAKL